MNNIFTRNTYNGNPFLTRRPAKTQELYIRYFRLLGIIIVKGESTSNKVDKRYLKLVTDLEEHFAGQHSLTIHFGYSLFNCLTAKYIFSIIQRLNFYQQSGKDVRLIWSCDSGQTEMIEAGSDFRDLCEFEFEFNLI